MITVFLLSFVVIALALLGMAVGVLLGGAPLTGSCGGLGQFGLNCSGCARPCAEKRKRRALHVGKEI